MYKNKEILGARKISYARFVGLFVNSVLKKMNDIII